MKFLFSANLWDFHKFLFSAIFLFFFSVYFGHVATTLLRMIRAESPYITNIYSLNTLCFETIASYLESCHEVNQFYAALISGRKEPNSEYRALLETSMRKMMEWMMQRGEAIGWSYKANFSLPTKVRRLSDKWKNPYFCQACGKYSISSRDLRFISSKSKLRVCTACLFKEWEYSTCHCGKDTTFCDYPERVNRMFQTERTVVHDRYSNGRSMYKRTFVPQKWHAVCEKRLTFIQSSTMAEKQQFILDAARRFVASSANPVADTVRRLPSNASTGSIVLSTKRITDNAYRILIASNIPSLKSNEPVRRITIQEPISDEMTDAICQRAISTTSLSKIEKICRNLICKESVFSTYGCCFTRKITDHVYLDPQTLLERGLPSLINSLEPSKPIPTRKSNRIADKRNIEESDSCANQEESSRTKRARRRRDEKDK